MFITRPNDRKYSRLMMVLYGKWNGNRIWSCTATTWLRTMNARYCWWQKFEHIWTGLHVAMFISNLSCNSYKLVIFNQIFKFNRFQSNVWIKIQITNFKFQIIIWQIIGNPVETTIQYAVYHNHNNKKTDHIFNRANVVKLFNRKNARYNMYTVYMMNLSFRHLFLECVFC